MAEGWDRVCSNIFDLHVRRGLALAMAIALGLATASAARATDPEQLGSAWAAGSAGLLKVRSTDHTLQLEVPSAGNVSTVAIDRTRRIVWAYAQPNLYSHDLAGNRLTSTTIPGTGTESELVVRPSDGSVWLSVDSTLHNVTLGGQLVRSVAGPGIVKQLAVDGASSVVWAATASKVTAHDAVTGAQIGSLTDLGNKPKVLDISLLGSNLWVALSGSLRWYKTAGSTATFQEQKGLSGVLLIDQVSTSTGGELWAVKSNEVLALDFSTLILSTGSLGNPFAAGEAPVAIAAATGLPGSVWIATSTSRLIDVGVSNVYLPISPPVTLRDVTMFPRETTPPAISFTSSSGLTGDPFQPVSLTYSDSGSGIDTSSLAVSGSSGPSFSCNAGAASATCTPTTRLAEGTTTLDGSVRDLAGNLASTSRTIRVDSLPPTVAFASPADGAVLSNPNPTFAISYSDAGGIYCNSFRIAAEDPTIAFDCSSSCSAATCTARGGLPVGTHTITASIQDSVGNTGSAQVTVTMPGADTTPPTLVFSGPRAGGAVADRTPLLKINYSDIGMGVDYATLAFTVGGQPLAVSCMYDTTGAGCTPTMAFALGPVSVAATVRDLAGNVSSPASVAFTIVDGRTEIRGVVRRADGTPAAGAAVFLLGKPGATTVAAADGSFVIGGVASLSGERLTLGAHLVVGADLYTGGVTVAPALAPARDVGAIVLQRLCEFGYEDAFAPGDDVSGPAKAFAVFDNGSGPALYVGGVFQYAGGQDVGYVARWNGTSWSKLGSGVNGEVKALAVFDDGSGPALYAAGAFDLAGGQPASNIARWNGTSWNALGAGTSNVVNALQVYDDGSGPVLYATGGFLSAGGLTVNRIARWDGFSWSALGSGLNNEAKSLAVFAGAGSPALYVGGGFTLAGGAAAQNLARWNGTAWSAPPTPGYTVSTMAVHAGASGIAALYLNGAAGVSKFDGTTMAAVAGGPTALALLSYDDGRGAQLYAGVDAPGLLRWDDDLWRGVGGGLNREVSALAIEAGAGFPLPLIVSGNFTTAGGVPMPPLARWAPQCNPPDRQAPTIHVTSPVGGSVTTAGSVTITGDVDEQATVTIDGQPVALDSLKRFSKGPVTLTEGLNAFVIAATDAAGNAARADVRVVRDTVAPVLRFVYPVQGQTLTTALPRLEFSFSDAVGVDARTLAVTAGTTTLPVSCNAGGELLQCSLASPLSNGSVTLAARIRDLAGNLSAAAQITVTVSPGAASGTTAIAGSVGLVGGASIGGAQVFVQGQPAALAVSAANGSFTIAGVLGTNGQPLTVIARQTAGGATLVGYATATAPTLGGTTNVGRITLHPVCAASFDQSFVAGYGVDGDYPWKYPDFYDTGFRPEVRALAVYDDGTGSALYVGGTFKQAGGIPANFIARFDGVRWSALGSAVRGGGMDGYVQSLVVFNDGSGNKLYAGGYFTAVDGQSIAHLAKWDGTSWSAVGGGIAGSAVMALAVWNNALYAAGQFSTAGTTAVRNVARWNGSSWAALGNGLGTSGNMVYALVEHKRLSGSGTALWAGGDFTISGTSAMKRVAAWDGSAWAEVGGGVGTATDDYSGFFNVSSLGVYKSELYAGGWFQGAGANGSVSATGVARWDGRKWNAVGTIAVTGFLLQEPAGVQALTAFNDGSVDALYALGLVDVAGITPRRDVLRWNGTTWSANGNGPSGSGYGGGALRVWDDPTDGAPAKLFAGSGMSSLVNSGVKVKGLAAWDGVAWRSVGAGLTSGPRSLAVFDNGSGPSLYTAGATVNRMSRVPPPVGKASSWTELPTLSGWIDTLAVLDMGAGPALYAAGSFTTPSPWSGQSVARWDGGSWVPLGKGIQGEVQALTTFDAPGGRVIVAGGLIETVDGVDFNGIAQWDGATWRPLGTGIARYGSVWSLAQHDDGHGRALFACGDFDSMGGEPTSGIARWNGTSWSAVGTNAHGHCTALATYDDGNSPQLYAAGSIALDGGAEAYRVVRWDGNRWTPAGGVFFDPTLNQPGRGLGANVIETLTVADDGTGPALFAVGSFSSVDGELVDRIARWDGARWVAVGSDLGSGAVWDLAAFDDGSGPALFAAGHFAYGNYGKKSDYGYLSSAGEVYYLAKLRRPLVCTAPDTTPPALAITAPAAGAILDTPTPQIALAYSDLGSGVDTASLVLTANGSPLAATCSFGVASATCTPTSPLAEGQVNLAATIRDAAGNLSPMATLAFRISIGAPFVTIVSPADNAVLASNTPRITINYSSASIPSTLQVQIVTSPANVAVTCAAEGNQALCDPTPRYADGLTVLSITIKNGAGATSDPAIVHFTVDSLPPTVGFTAPAAGATVYAARPQLRLALADAGAGIDTATLAVLEGTAALSVSCSFDATGATCTPVAALADGAHTLSATVRDRTGKTSAAATVTFTIDTSDTTPPSIVVNTPVVTNQSAVVMSGSLSEQAALTVNGSPAAVAPDLTFSFGPVTLLEGANPFHLAATDLTGNVGTRDVSIVLDTARPALTFAAPASGSLCSPTGQQLSVSWSDVGSGIDANTLSFKANGSALAASCQSTSGGAVCTAGALPNGSVDLSATVRDAAGNLSAAVSVLCFTDPNLAPPQISIYAPAPDSAVNTQQVRIFGALSKPATLAVDGQSVAVAADLSFEAGPYALSAGLNTFSLDAQDGSGTTTHLSLHLTFDAETPDAVRADRVSLIEQFPGEQGLVGAAGAVATGESGIAVVVQDLATGGEQRLTPAPDGSFQTALVAFPGDIVRLTVRDAAGNDSAPLDLRASGSDPVPADPATVAPPLDPSSSVDACDLVSFFWTGTSRVQFGVQTGEIDCERLAVVRGHILDQSGAPIAGVRVLAIGQPEHGVTFSRGDGSFDFAVRAQDRVVLTFSRPGYFSVQRTLQLVAQQFTTLDDVVLTAPDAAVTTIDASGNAPAQAARGNVVTDELGSRRATVLFPAAITAALQPAGGGAAQPQGALQVRATELSVGPDAQLALPGTLPADLAFSYAIEISVDAAEATGAGVEPSRPVPIYVEDFLDVPVGTEVDLYTLDRAAATWQPLPAGRIIQVLAISGGLADLDLDGSGTPATAQALQALGIDDGERAQLASLYGAGQRLSRVAVPHFSTFIESFFRRGSFQLPSPILTPPVPGDDSKLDHPSIAPYAGTIETENQILREALGLVGTPFTLHYASDRVPGRVAPYELEVKLTGEGITPIVLSLVRRIDLAIDIAGQSYKRSFAPANPLSHTFTWDRRDGYGRELPGQAQWVAKVSYVTSLGTGARSETASTYTYSGTLGTMNAAGALGLGGWTLSANHFYDRPNGTLYYGDGRRRSVRSKANNPWALELVAGTGERGLGGDGGDARRAKLDYPAGLSVTPDGSLLIADHQKCRIRRVSAKDGRISTIAGTVCRSSGAQGKGDGGLATAAILAGPVKAVETIDGSVYIADFEGQRIRRVDKKGIITTVVGNGVEGCADGQLASPHDIALDKDGGLLIANRGKWQAGPNGAVHVCDSIQRYTPGVGLETVVERRPFGDVSWINNEPQGVATGPDGSIYFTPAQAVAKRPPGGGADAQHPAWVVAGAVRYYVGDEDVFAGDGKPASYETRFFLPTYLAVGPDGTVYVVDRLNQRIRTISPAERVDTLVGGGDLLPVGDGVAINDGVAKGNGLAARRARLADPTGIALDPKHHVLYFADGELHQVWKVRLDAPASLRDEVPEEDGSLLYVFDEHGHQLRTEDAITEQTLLTFNYTDIPTSGGRTRHLLRSITDPFGNETEIVRGGNGDASSIKGPYGQETTLQINATTGYLQSVTGGGSTVGVTHDANGLLRSLVDPRSGTYDFAYDSKGRLIRGADPAGGSLELVRSSLGGGWKVRQQTGLGRASEVEVWLPPEDASLPTLLRPEDRVLRFFTDTAGLKTELREGLDDRDTATGADGTTSKVELEPDPNPKLADMAPNTRLATTATPANLSAKVAVLRPEESNTPGQLWTATATFNEIRSSTSSWAKSASGGTISEQSPGGRSTTTKVDAVGLVTQSQVPGIAVVEPSYDGRGRLASVQQASRTTSWSFDPQGYVKSITDPLMRTTSFVRDAQGRVTTQTLPGSRAIGFGYDANGNLTSLTPPNKPTHTFSYNQVDQVDTATPPAIAGGGATAYAYNLDHQLELITRPDGLTIDPAYDVASGRLVSLTTPTGTTSISYDPTSGRVASVAAPAGGGSITYSYDGPVLTGVSQSGPSAGSVTYTRDDAGSGLTNFWIASRTINGTDSVAFQYDADGLLTAAGPLQLQRNPANGLLSGTTLLQTTEIFDRNTYGEVMRLQSTFSGTGCASGCTVLDQTYTRDQGGRITGMTETTRDPGSTASETHTYVYTFDTPGRLTEVKRDGAVWETFGYDANSNRTSWSGPWGSGAATYDAQDRLLTYGSKSYTYTPNGELLTRTQGGQTDRFTYDVLGNLRKVELAAGTTIDYVIDAANRRIGKKVAGTLVKGFLYGTGSSPVAELDGSGNVVSTFIYAAGGNVPDAMVKGGITYRIVTDHLGSVRWVLNAATGAVAQHLDYDPFGRVTLDTNPGFQPFGFAGGLYDYQTGLVRFGARDYDAETGRWASKDPIGFAGGDTNLYGYVVGDPINGVDASGLDPTVGTSGPTFDGGDDVLDALSRGWAWLQSERTQDTGQSVTGLAEIGLGLFMMIRTGGQEGEEYLDEGAAGAQRGLGSLLRRTTRLGATRNNPADWRRLRNLWDEVGYGSALSQANRRAIARGRTPVVDDDWVNTFPEDTAYQGQQIRMHHIQGSPFTVPLPEGRHLDAHMPGGFRYNPGGPG